MVTPKGLLILLLPKMSTLNWSSINDLITLYLLVVPVGILQAVMGNPPPAGILQHGAGSPLPVEDNLRPVGDSHRPEGGSPRLVEGKLQTEVGRHQVAEGMPLPAVGSLLSVVGIQGSSFLEYEEEAGW